MKAKKYLGQHFLKDKNIIKKILEFSDINKEDLVLEIGPGKGALTNYIFNYTDNVVLIEKDKDLIPFLKKNFPKALIFNLDACNLNLEKIFSQAKKFFQKDFENIKIISNLPYNVGNIILINLLSFFPLIKDITVMVQKEVAERIAADPKSKKYGFLSVLLQTFFKIKKGFNVPPKAFFPPPKVYSSVIKLIPKPYKEVKYFYENIEKYKKFLTKAFSQRRKKLKNVCPFFPKEFLDKRAEEIDVESYKEIFRNLNCSCLDNFEV